MYALDRFPEGKLRIGTLPAVDMGSPRQRAECFAALVWRRRWPSPLERSHVAGRSSPARMSCARQTQGPELDSGSPRLPRASPPWPTKVVFTI
ncbi:hypothetical protein MTO96_016528 [Rhipicephalus appendiculatus]